MIQQLNDQVSVILEYDNSTRTVKTKQVKWAGRKYPITKTGLHHTQRQGRTLYHIFSVTSGNLFLRLSLNTDNLHWILTEVSDGLPS